VFRGNTHLLLLEQIASNVKKTRYTRRRYAPYMTFVQSSGMGKSRILDEVAKHVVLIPVNVRQSNSTGMSVIHLCVTILTSGTRISTRGRAFPFVLGVTCSGIQTLRSLPYRALYDYAQYHHGVFDACQDAL
jgi:hypothetical protein